MSEHILASASNVGWAGLLALLQQIGRFRHRDVKQFSQVETTQRGEGPQVYGSWGSTLSPRSLLPETLKEETRARLFLQVTLSAYYVLVGRDRVVNALVCLRIWKRSFSLGNVQRKKICVSQVLGCYKQDEGMLICLRRDTLLSQDGALLSHLLERKKAGISRDRRARWLSAAQSLLCEGHIPIEEERSGLTHSASSTPLGFTPACLRTDIPATVTSKADIVTARTIS